MSETNNNFFNYLNTEPVNNIEIIATKSSKKNILLLGEIFTFTIKITNLSNIDLINVILYEDELLPEEQYIANSFTINNKNIYIGSFPYYGINIGAIPSKTSSVITYEVVFNMLPSTPQVSSHVVIYYSYSDLNSNLISNSIVTDSNIITIQNPNQSSLLNSTTPIYMNPGPTTLPTPCKNCNCCNCCHIN